MEDSYAPTEYEFVPYDAFISKQGILLTLKLPGKLLLRPCDIDFYHKAIFTERYATRGQKLRDWIRKLFGMKKKRYLLQSPYPRSS